MFGFRKFVRKEFEKIANGFNKRDEKIARLEGAISVLMKSQSHRSLNKSQNKIETKLINRIRRTKKSRVVAEINKLMPSLSIPEIKLIIVDQKGFCSKASFYRYITSLKSQNKIEPETNLRQLNQGGKG